MDQRRSTKLKQQAMNKYKEYWKDLGVTAEGKGIAAQATCQVMFY